MFEFIKVDFPEVVASSIMIQFTNYVNGAYFGVIRDL